MYSLFLWAAHLVPRLPRWLLRMLPAILGPLGGERAGRQLSMLDMCWGADLEQTVAGRRVACF